MNVAIITTRESPLAALRTGLEQRHARVESFGDGWSFLQAVRDQTDRTRSWELVIVDGLSLPFRDLIEKLLEINASLNTAVITDLEPQAFHEASEGLGILAGLPASPSPEDVESLLEKLQAVGGLDPALEAAQSRLDAMGRRHHPQCVVCWERHPFGLKVDYRVTGEHTVEGTFACGKSYEGYGNVVHGGIVSCLLDGAMASCMLAKGREAYTVDLRIRFRAPVDVGIPALIRGEWIRQANHLHLLQATLLQDGKPRASARAKFMEGSPASEAPSLHPGSLLRGLVRQSRQRIH